MQYKHVLFGLALILFSFTACKEKEETGIDFDVTFKALYDGNQLEKNKIYPFGAYPINFQRFRLYMSDITLIKGSEEVRVSEIEYLDFTPDNAVSDLSVTPTITFKNVPEGSYDGIRIGFGVKSALNAKQPADFPANNPLSIETDYWLGWRSYIFMVLDGRADPDNDGAMNFAFSYHCGSDPVYRTFTFNHHIHVEQGHTGLQIDFDVRKLLINDDGTYYDIQSNPATSNDVSNTRVAEDIMSRFDSATFIRQ